MGSQCTNVLIVAMATMLVTMVTNVSSTRCYQCRDVIQKQGNRRIFKEKYADLVDMGWIVPCNDDAFVIHPQVGCVKRVYFTQQMCTPKKKCIAKVIEYYPVLPAIMTEGIAFFSQPFSDLGRKDEKHCRGDLCNNDYKEKHDEGLKCYYQCGRISLIGLTNEELEGYDLPVIPCDDNTINYCSSDMECGVIVGSANYTDAHLGRDITVHGWFSHCFYKDSDSIDHVLKYVEQMMQEHPSLQISPKDLTKCNSELCNTLE